MVTLWAVVAGVVDPELQVVTIADLGILRDVSSDVDGRVTVTITPTYSGCPALDAIRADIDAALRDAGHQRSTVVTELRPAWSTDMISEEGRRKLAEAGISPPSPTGPAGSSGRVGSVALRLTVRCPQCGSPETEELARFGATACLALWRCKACAEPFERVKSL